MRHGRLAAGRGVLDAERVAAGIDAVDAVAGADALADVVDPAFHQLADEVRVGDVGAGHGDHVDMAFGHRAAGGVEVGDALGVEDRDVDLALDGAGEEQEGRHRERHVGQHDGVGQMVARLPAQDVGEVDQPALRIGAGDGDAVLVRQAVVDQLVAGHAHADDVVVADRFAAGFKHFDAEAHAVFQAAAVFVGALVDGRAPELVDQVAVGGGQLEAVQAAFLAAAGGGGVVGDDAADVGVFHLLRDGAAGRLALGRRRHGRQPVLGVPPGAPAHVGELDHQRRTVPVDAVGELLEEGDDAVVGDGDLVPGRRRAVQRHRGGAAEHGQADAALGLLLVVELIALLGLAVLAVGWRVRRAHHPVADGQVLDFQGAEKRFDGRHVSRFPIIVTVLRIRPCGHSHMPRRDKIPSTCDATTRFAAD